jgi:quercetin dioxygenase-like cupin family protein
MICVALPKNFTERWHMTSRRKFLQHGSVGILSICALPATSLASNSRSATFGGLVVSDEEGEAVRGRDGSAIIRIKAAKTQGAESVSFVAESFRPGDEIPVHKHANEDEFIFLHRGSGLFTLGEKEYPIKEGAFALVSKGTWHGLKNTGTENIEMRFGYSPAGFEGFFREVGTPVGLPFVPKTKEERKAIAKKWGMIYKDL